MTFESFIESHAIEIPAIQRDYVQGRDRTIEERDKRDIFIDRLIDSLTNENKDCHLEFIYGAEDMISGYFIPLDGQQRLTTLFLLHWVIWQKSSPEVQERYPLVKIAKFSYETRISSTNFCHALTSKNLLRDTLSEKEQKSLKQILQKQPWFSEEWNFDPTIQAMLSMIECMEKKLSDHYPDGTDLILMRLNSENFHAITFDELNMHEYELTDSLYIKMNARGKQLTKFENWKSDFIKFLESEFDDASFADADEGRKIKYSSYKDYFCYSIEHEWTDLLWSYLKSDYLKLDNEEKKKQYPAIDSFFMNFFHFLCSIFYYKSKTQNIEYRELSAKQRKEIYEQTSFIDFLFSSLDSLCRIQHGEFFDRLFYVTEDIFPVNNNEQKIRLFTKEKNLFRLCINEGTSMDLMEQLLFYALIRYCNKYKIRTVDEPLKVFIREIRNYLETEIQNLRTRTIVQPNLRTSNIGEYDEYISGLLENTSASLKSEEICIIEDCSFIRGHLEALQESINEYGEKAVFSAMNQFCNLSDLERIRLLVACQYQGTYLSDCIGRKRRFFGCEGKWDVIFISDSNNVGPCLNKIVKLTSTGKDYEDIMCQALYNNQRNFAYYMIKYDEFATANSSRYHFAVKGDIDDVDLISLGSYSSNPGTAYHTDPLAVAVEKRLNYSMPLNIYKQYSGKCALTVLEDKINWKGLFSLISRKDGWHIIDGENYITEEMVKQYHLMKDSSGNFLLRPDDENDMVEICEKFLRDIYPKLNNK